MATAVRAARAAKVEMGVAVGETAALEAMAVIWEEVERAGGQVAPLEAMVGLAEREVREEGMAVLVAMEEEKEAAQAEAVWVADGGA